MPPSTWLFNAIAPMATSYLRRRYRRKIGNALYNRMRRSYTTRTAYLRGTSRSNVRPRNTKRGRLLLSSNGAKRGWSRAMGVSNVPSARTKFRRTAYYRGLGLSPKNMPCKKYFTEATSSAIEDKSMAFLRVVKADYDGNDAILNRRNGRLCNVRGVKMRHWFALKNFAESSVVLDAPVQIRWAILNPKVNTGNKTTDITLTNFFVNEGTASNEDAIDFKDATGICFDYMNRKINRRKYGVVQEGMFELSNDPGSNNSRVGRSARKLLNLWIPINRQMKWSSNTALDADPTTNLYFVWWYCQEADKDTGRKFIGGAIDHTYERITYFKDSTAVTG